MAGPKARFHLPFHQWPIADQRLWEAATSDSDPFSDAAGALLAETSKEQYLFAWRRYLGFLTLHEPSAIKLDPTERITPGRVRLFVDHLGETNIPRSVAIQVDALYKAARVMLPQHNWSWLKSIKARLHTAAPLQRATGPVITSLQILTVGQRLMDEFDPQTNHNLTLAQASRYRDGLMLAFLAFAPLRRKNLAALQIDRHLIRPGESWFITIPAIESKTRTDLEYAIPSLLLPYLAVYLETVRPRIAKDPECKALWTSPRGGAIRYSAIGKLIARHTELELGIRITPHDARDAAATMWALARPDQINVARDLLSHSDLRTTEKHYIRAQGLQASRTYASLVKQISRTAKFKTSRR